MSKAIGARLATNAAARTAGGQLIAASTMTGPISAVKTARADRANRMARLGSQRARANKLPNPEKSRMVNTTAVNA